MKRLLLVVAAAAAFLIGYGSAAGAWPGVPDRDRWFGYFQNIKDIKGGMVNPGGIPSYVDTAPEFIQFIRDMLNSGNGRLRVGASFIVQTMLGSPWYRNDPPDAFQMADWESRVYRYANNGWIDWNYSYEYTINSYWQGTDVGSNPNDDAFYFEHETWASIRFRNGSSGEAYVLKRACVNPVGNTNMAGLSPNYLINGSTTVQATAFPGDTVTFQHYLTNTGDTTPTVWFVPFEGPSSAGTGLPSPGSSVTVWAFSTVNAWNENFRIPDTAAAGTRYCRMAGWDPTNSWGGRDGRGAEACVRVEVPAKLKAAMSASPKPIQPGDTITFAPTISAVTSGSPVTVNCVINRGLYSPTGVYTNLGAQPCVDSSGNPNIVIPMGGSVNLRPNNYASSNSIAIGSRVCDVINITVPASPLYFNSPADRTAEDCSTVAKAPYVHFLGGDVWAGGGFAAVAPGTCNTSGKITTVTRNQSVADGTRPGSGTTYAAFALNRITNFGSGGVARVTATGEGDNWTFSNINAANLGFFGVAQHCINDYAASYASLPLSAPPGINNPVSGAWHVTGPINLAGTMPLGDQPGGHKVYFVDGDVNLNGVISYPASYANAAQIPSLVVIATGNIRVLDVVNRVDGIYIARNTFYTCHPKVEPETINNCNVPLVVNGAVSSTALDLHRTAGADGATPGTQKAPAEVFNMSPEVFLSNALNQTSQTTITTSNIRELPPRF